VAARLAEIAVVVTTEHIIGATPIEGRRKPLPVRLLYLATKSLSDAKVAVSTKVRKLLVAWGVPQAKIRGVPNDLHPERFTFDSEARHLVKEEFGIPERDFELGSVGRLYASKRYDRLLTTATPLLRHGA
jgi:glycosyltransferase involved in cell wall biosynthesis